MKYDEFIKQVQGFAQINSRADAEKAAQATLETLKERIVGDEAIHLAAQLPEEMGQYLRGREGENGQFFSLQDFYTRVSQRLGVDAPTAAMRVRAVFAVLNKAVTPGEFRDVKANLSDDYAELFAPS